ncbi:hypothetical protein SS50377_26685 [Spironucleus salmonicida]|uniref:Uncharacterized protein n=1 Tax=Spironucleus salmonicida TaxID=348837 RepID=A0A9P8LLQ6_9EUKA|nr:hypothetical protein SS50377_26685 [Spironucleus salmonicida]
MQRVEDEPEIMDEFSKAYRWYRDKYIKSNLKEGVLYAEPGFDSVSQQIFQNNNQVNLKVNTQYDILRRWYSFKYVVNYIFIKTILQYTLLIISGLLIIIGYISYIK